MKLRVSFFCLLVFVLFTQAACAAKRGGVDSSYAPESSQRAGETKSIASRDLIKTASIEVVVPSVPDSIDAATRLVNEAGGYTYESVTKQDSVARLKLRVPSQKLSEVLAGLSKLGEEKRRQITVQDVTDQVADLDATLENKKALRDRLRLLLSRANDVKDILSVESELTRLQTEIDSLEGNLNRLRTDIAYAAVDLQLTPRAEQKPKMIRGPLGYLFAGTGWILKKLWVIREGE